MKLFKQKLSHNDWINIIVSIVLIVMGLLLLILSSATNARPVTMLYVVFTIYSVIKAEEYFITKPKDDYEELYSAIVCGVAALSGFKFNMYNPQMVLALTLVSWVGAMCVIKLIKIDYYHDRKNKMMYINLGTFFLFLLLGLLTSINLYFSEQVQSLMLGFYFIVIGLLDMSEDLIRILSTKNIL